MAINSGSARLSSEMPTESSPLINRSSHGDGQEPPHEVSQYGSDVSGAVFNFINSIVGAGAIGLGGAIAASGGLVATISIFFFAFLTKVSFDVVIELSVEETTQEGGGSYEELGRIAYGALGHHAVLISKFLYSFGCLVAYIVIIKDNFASALLRLISDEEKWGMVPSDTISFLHHEDLITWILSLTVILPLCVLRHMTLLEKASTINFLVVIFILGIVIYVFAANPNGEVRVTEGTTYEHWFQIRSGLMESLGTFVFTFVAQHNVHQIYHSLRPHLRNIKTFQRVSTWAVVVSTLFSIGMGLFVYMTFWETTTSNMFESYPVTVHMIDVAKLLLCLEMMLTFPLPFFACRELLILSIVHATSLTEIQEVDKDDGASRQKQSGQEDMYDENKHQVLSAESTQPQKKNQLAMDGDEEYQAFEAEYTAAVVFVPREEWWLLRTSGRHNLQLILPLHLLLCFVLWGVPTYLAIAAPSLGDVLNLVGSATGTLIAFILPGLFSFRLRGPSCLGWLILVVGGVMGFVGTVYSTTTLIEDIKQQ